MPAYGRSSAPNHSGVHFLAAPRVIGELVRSCRIGTGDLVLDLSAITAPLAGTGANVRVHTGDIRTIPLPGKDFYVVSSIPYAASTTLFRRLLGPSRSALRRAAIVVEWGFAKRVTAAVPRDAELAWWAARFEIRLGKRIPARCFQPAPRVDSARVDIRRAPGLTPLADRALWTLLDAAYRTPGKPVRAAIGFALAKRNPHKLLGACGIDPAAPAGHVPPERWAVLARTLAEDRSLHWPPLPKALSGKGNSRDGNGGHGLLERGTRGRRMRR